MNVRLIVPLFLLAASANLFTTSAQVNTSTISGTVTDESGSGVPNAKVLTTIIATGQQRDAVTKGVGEFFSFRPLQLPVCATFTGIARSARWIPC
jgi:hypothetical protein